MMVEISDYEFSLVLAYRRKVEALTKLILWAQEMRGGQL